MFLAARHKCFCDIANSRPLVVMPSLKDKLSLFGFSMERYIFIREGNWQKQRFYRRVICHVAALESRMAVAALGED